MTSHAHCVEAWLASRASAKPSTSHAARLLAAGLEAICKRARASLGDVTLAAIWSRVRYSAERESAVLSHVHPSKGDRFSLEIDPDDVRDAAPDDVLHATRFVLVELLTVIGRLTGDALVPGLHLELASTTLPEREEQP